MSGMAKLQKDTFKIPKSNYSEASLQFAQEFLHLIIFYLKWKQNVRKLIIFWFKVKLKCKEADHKFWT